MYKLLDISHLTSARQQSQATFSLH